MSKELKRIKRFHAAVEKLAKQHKIESVEIESQVMCRGKHVEESHTVGVRDYFGRSLMGDFVERARRELKQLRAQAVSPEQASHLHYLVRSAMMSLRAPGRFKPIPPAKELKQTRREALGPLKRIDKALRRLIDGKNYE